MDGRLFVNAQLYCEGKSKPWFRGKIHLLSLVFIAPAIYFSKNNIWSHINIITNFCCFGVSGIYHTFDWSPHTEIMLQKLDHQMISVWCVGMMMPIAFNMFEPGVRAKFLTALLATFFYYPLMVTGTVCFESKDFLKRRMYTFGVVYMICFLFRAVHNFYF